MGKSKDLMRHLPIPQDIFYWTKVTRNDFGVLPISMTSGSLAELRIGWKVMLLTSSGMGQDLHTNTSKFEMWESTSSMEVLQERILMIDHIAVVSWDMQLLQELFSTRSQTSILLSTEPIMFGVMNIIPVSPYKTRKLQVLYYFNKTLKVLFIIKTSSTWFYVNLILHSPH